MFSNIPSEFQAKAPTLTAEKWDGSADHYFPREDKAAGGVQTGVRPGDALRPLDQPSLRRACNAAFTLTRPPLSRLVRFADHYHVHGL